MKRPKFAHKSLNPSAAEPFDNAEEAWFWAMSCLVAREDGARFVAGLAHYERPCSPDDLIVSAERMGAAGRLKRSHLQVLAGYGRRLLAPDSRARDEQRAARLWDEALDLLATVWRRKGIVA
ncbi:MAG: hypothetical protein OXC10_05870 [Rhodospirillaceae bacterium]|nr:hypothetical protein [Rhodospirillaceae bacterium]